MSSSTRIIKNTGYLYIKMGVAVFSTLYSTRLILASLGASDFGLFNVVGGAIVMLSFLNSTMANSTQRYLSYAEGEGQMEKKRTIFNISIVLHFVIAIFTLIIFVSAMYPLFNGVFNLEADRIFAAKVIYFSLVFSSVLTIINVPYDAVMTAHENMLYYSIVGIIESILKLGVAFICVFTRYDKLIVYGVLMACVPIITLCILRWYCHRHYSECIVSPHRYWDWSLVKQITFFFGWNFLTAISSLFTAQGIGIVLNHFYGTVLNAAQGIAHQVNGALSMFSGNMVKALNPVITKSAGANDNIAMNNAALAGCKYSALLTMFFGIPLSLEIKYVLSLWLKEVPAWASLFVVLLFVQNILLQMANSVSTAIYALGDIKNYAIWKSIMNALPVLLVWIAFWLGGSPLWLYIPMILVWAIGGNIVIIYFARIKCGLELKNYLAKVLFPLIGTAILMTIMGMTPLFILSPSFVRLTLTSIATTIGLLISALLFAMSREEKSLIKAILHKTQKSVKKIVE